MNLLQPTAITSLSLVGVSAMSGYPITNALLPSPREPFRAQLNAGVEVATIRVAVAGTFDSIVLLGVESSVVPVDITDDSGGAVAGATVATYVDSYYPARRNYWIRFTALTGHTLRVNVRRVSVAVGEIVRVGVLMAGVTAEYTGVLFPLEESCDDPTVQVPMADGSVYRGLQLQPVRTYAGTMRDAKATVAAFCSACRLFGGSASMWHFAPTLDDRHFVYGRLLQQPQASHAWPQYSSASFAVQEYV